MDNDIRGGIETEDAAIHLRADPGMQIPSYTAKKEIGLHSTLGAKGALIPAWFIPHKRTTSISWCSRSSRSTKNKVFSTEQALEDVAAVF